MKNYSQMVLPDGRMFINGEWRNSSDNQTKPNYTPITEEITSYIEQATEQDVNEAVKAAREAFDHGEWARMSGHQRGRYLIKVAQLIEKYADELAYLETLDMGKPITFAKTYDVTLLAELYYYYGGMASKIEGSTCTSNTPTFNYTLREPLGVVAAISPFNFPLLLSNSKIAPGLAAGNTFIHKPASATPLSALKMAQIFEEAGLPKGVVNVITGPGGLVGDILVKHKDVNKIAFTGSTVVGQEIMRNASQTMKKVTMELGGKSAHIIFADSDLNKAVNNAFFGIFYNKGEVCTAGSRLLVERSVYDQVIERLVQQIERTKLGSPLDPESLYGPLSDQGQLNKVAEYVAIGKEEGAVLVTGGERFDPLGDGKGFYYRPTIFKEVTENMRIFQEEIFGPVLTVTPFDTEEEAIRLANATTYGLAAGINTNDLTKAHRVAKSMEAGIVWVNTYNMFDIAVPFGGVKMSGFGREEGSEVMESYTHTKSVVIDMQ